MEIEAFNPRFKNWVRWANQTGYHQARVASAEGAYRSPQCWDEKEPPLPQCNILDAWLLNSAYLYSPSKVRRTIKILVFRPHWRAEWQAQKLGVHHTELSEALFQAKKAMSFTLDMLEQPANLEADYRLRVTASFEAKGLICHA